MLRLIGLLCSSVVSSYVLFHIMGQLYEKRYPDNKFIYWTSSAIYIILSILISNLGFPVVNVIFSFTILCILSVTVYSFGENIIVNSVIIIIYFCIIDVIITAVFSIFVLNNTDTFSALNDPTFFFVSGIGNSMLMLCTSSLLVQFIMHSHIDKVSKSLHTYMIFLCIFELGVVCYFLNMDTGLKSKIPLLGLCLGFIIVDGGVLYLFRMISKNVDLEKQADLLEQQREITIKYYEGLQERYLETQKLLHDMKKHIRVISNLESDKTDIKREYANELLLSIEDIQQQFQCTDKIVCAIIWDKMQVCKGNRITLDINMQDIEFNFMDKTEVTTLFANLLENAIEACQISNSENKEINLRIHQFKNYIVIKMRNTLGIEPQFKMGSLVSTKQGHFGIGMKILSDIANKYGGNLNYEYSEEYFETKIILFAAQQ